MTTALPVRIRGVVYPSQSVAAQRLGLHFSTISAALREGREDTVGTGAKPALRKPVTINGQRFPSHTAAAAWLNVTAAAINKAVQRGTHRVRPKGKGEFQ